VPMAERGFTCLDAGHALKPGVSLPAPQGVFPRIVEEEKIGAVG